VNINPIPAIIMRPVIMSIGAILSFLMMGSRKEVNRVNDERQTKVTDTVETLID
jgi:hypothetical protein